MLTNSAKDGILRPRGNDAIPDGEGRAMRDGGSDAAWTEEDQRRFERGIDAMHDRVAEAMKGRVPRFGFRPGKAASAED